MPQSTRHPDKNTVFSIVSLGCHKNLVDSEIIAGTLAAAGFIPSFDLEAAELLIINTCAFLPEARAEAEHEIEQAVSWKSLAPGRKIAVCGCLCEYEASGENHRRHPEVDLWVRVNDLNRLPELLAGAPPRGGEPDFLVSEEMPRLQFTLPHIAYLKIADGCNNCCSYCAIPRLRGRLRSREIASVTAEARRMVASGVREVVVIAQDTTAFGHDRPESGENLAGLLRELDRIEGDFRLRLLYTHPANYTDELISVLAGMKHLLAYIDIPLQHISDRILTAMNRHVNRARIEELIPRLRAAIPGLTLRTTFITGLPGETEAEFNELLEFARRIRFERLGVFPFAPEKLTPAAAFPAQVPLEIAEERAKILMKKQRDRMRRHNEKLIGTEMEMLIDFTEHDAAIGRSAMDAPEIDNGIVIPRPGRVRAGTFQQVKIIGVSGSDLLGRIVRRK